MNVAYQCPKCRTAVTVGARSCAGCGVPIRVPPRTLAPLRLVIWLMAAAAVAAFAGAGVPLLAAAFALAYAADAVTRAVDELCGAKG